MSTKPIKSFEANGHAPSLLIFRESDPPRERFGKNRSSGHTSRSVTRSLIKWDYAWATWLGSTLGSFAVLEAIAYRQQKFPTLSRTLRRWIGVHPSKPWGKAVLGAFFAFWCWMTIHILITPKQ